MYKWALVPKGCPVSCAFYSSLPLRSTLIAYASAFALADIFIFKYDNNQLTPYKFYNKKQFANAIL